MQVGEVWAHYPDDYRRNASRVEILEVLPRPKKDRYLTRFEDGRERSWCGALPTSRAEAAAAAEVECHRLWLLAHRLVNELAKHALPLAEDLRKELVNNQISADDVRAA